MAFRLGVGKSDFEEIRKVGDYYVDKSELLYDLVENVGNKVTLFSRPRRFGKTLTMSMIDNFFNTRNDSHAIFEGARHHEAPGILQGMDEQPPSHLHLAQGSRRE